MSSEWQTVLLGDVAELSGGYAFKSEEYTESGHFVLRTVNITDDGRIDRRGATFVSLEAARKYERFALKPFDTLFVMVGATLGKTGFVKTQDLPALLNQNMWLIRAKPSLISPLYLHYAFKVFSQPLLGMASGSARGFVKRDDFRQMIIPLPSAPEQVRISSLLGALDDRITLLRETNATLEAIAQALFKSWFVDFDPVRAKQEGRAPEGMSDATAALFPDSFEESELGLVPKGWRVGTLGDVAQTARQQMQVSDLHADLHYVGLEHIPRKSLSLTAWGNAEGLESAKAAFSEGDILFGKLRPYFHKVVIAPFSGVCSTDILVCQPRTKAYFGLVAMHLFSETLIEYADRLSNGAKMPRVNWKDLAAYPICIPPTDVATELNEAIHPLVARMNANTHQAQTLATLRDTLLPRLISGQLRLPEAEALIEEATA